MKVVFLYDAPRKLEALDAWLVHLNQVSTNQITKIINSRGLHSCKRVMGQTQS